LFFYIYNNANYKINIAKSKPFYCQYEAIFMPFHSFYEGDLAVTNEI